MQSEAVAQFIAATRASSQTASRYIAQYNNDVSRAISAYRRVHGGNARSHVVTLNDLNDDSTPQFPEPNGDSGLDDRHRGLGPTDLFIGGEHSGLAVTNPNARSSSPRSELVNSILRQAQNTPPNPSDSVSSGEHASLFHGGGSRLGSTLDTTPDDQVAVEEAAADDSSEDLPIVKRTLHFWRNGFSIDDGPLYSFDEPENDVYLRAIYQGRAPIGLLNVAHNQSVDVRVDNRPNEDYVALKRPRTLSNAGNGQMLGSYVGSPTENSPEPTEESTDPASKPPTAQETAHGDAPVQIRLADGSAHRLRLNSAGSVQQLYDFVDSHSGGQQYILQTQFPRHNLEDRQQSLKDADVVNAVVIQRLT